MRIKKLLLHLLYVAAIALYAYFIGCPIKRLTGFDCPFCGMTRAHTAFFCGDFERAFNCHELFFLGIPSMLALAHLRILKKRKKLYISAIVFCILCAIAFISRYIIKAVL